MKRNIGIISFLISFLLFGSLAFSPLKADTAGLLPWGVQQFFDNNGNPLTSGYVYNYTVGTSTLKNTWQDSGETILNTNPIRLNAAGRAIIYGSGTYRQVVKDKNGNLIWDAVTTPTGSGGATPTAVGDGNLVGTILPWSGLIAPNQYAFAYGQEIARATYPDLFTAITLQTNVICSASSNTLTGIVDTTQINVGAPIELSLCVIPGTTVVSKTASTVVLSNPSSVSINSVARFFPWGNGNGTTTFNIPDLRGNVLAGRTNMGGSASTNLTTAGYGANTPAALGAIGGSQTNILTQSNLPAFKPTLTSTIHDPGHAHTVAADLINIQNGGTTIKFSYAAGTSTNPSSTNTTGITADTVFASNLGSSTAFAIVQPTITVNYIVKVLPDTSTSIATGVYSVGGMSGVIACGSGLICTGNIVSTVPYLSPSLTTNNFFIGNASGVATDTALSGDCTYGASGIICTKTNNVSFASSATTDTTNATNISTGTLNTARLPSPFTNGTISGNTSKFTTISGTQTLNNCLKSDANGNLTDTGLPCGISFANVITPTLAAANAVTPTDALSIASGAATLTSGTSRFVVGDIGKLISIPDIGPNVAYATASAQGAGYTNGTQTLTISGGTCSIAPQVVVTVVTNVVASISSIANVGNCTVQPTNPVATTGGGGAGATLNLFWVPLSTTISGYTSGTQVTLGANSSLTLASVSKTYMYGTNDQSALQTAINATIAASANGTPTTLQLCGSYAVSKASGIALDMQTGNSGISITGICAGTRILYAGTGNYDGLHMYGLGTQTATTTITSNSLQGSSILQLTSSSGFSVGDYITITNNTTNGNPRGEFNQITTISGNTITLLSALSFDTDISKTTAVANMAVSERFSLSDISFECTYAAGTVSGGLRLQYATRAKIKAWTRNCNTLNSFGSQLYGVYSSEIDINDYGSGNLSASDAISSNYIGGSKLNLFSSYARGFGIGLSQGVSRNEIRAIANTTLGRAIKLFGANANWGSLSSTNSPSGNAGYNTIAFSGGSSYNHFSQITGIGAGGVTGAQGNCLWSSGDQNINNTIDHLSIANCPIPISINATDTGWTIGTIDYGSSATNSANSIIESTAQVGAAVTPGFQRDCLYGANFNSTSDQAITMHPASRNYLINQITISNPSVSMTTAAGGFYTGAGKTGVIIVAAAQTYSTLTTNTANTTGSLMAATIAGTITSTYMFNANPIYLSLTTGQGVAATADVCIHYRPL